MNPIDDSAALADLVAGVFYSLATALDRYREAHQAEVTDEVADGWVTQAQQWRHLGDDYNDAAARARLAAVKDALATLGEVTAQVKQQLKNVIRIEQIFSIANAAVGFGEAVATGGLSAIGPALGGLAKAAAPLVETAGAGSGTAAGGDA